MTGNAKIKSAKIGYHDGYGSIPTVMIYLEGDGWGQGFGGYGLGPDAINLNQWVYGLLDVFQADSFDKIVGLPCRFERDENGTITRIGDFMKDRWFDPKKDVCPVCQ